MKPPHLVRKVFEVSITAPPLCTGAVDVLRNVLTNAGIRQEDLIEQNIDRQKILTFYVSSLRQAKAFESKIAKAHLKGLDVRTGVLHEDDWLTRWKKDWKPFALTSKLDVVPTWCQESYTFGKRDYIFLDTVSSFGTGLHETTQFMAQFVESLKGKFKSCLDIGTGTGILALVALKQGANQVVAIDIDDMCTSATLVNMKANGYQEVPIILSDLKKFRSRQKFDLVCANLVTHDLVKMKRKILSFVKAGGWLAVSGVSVENLPILRRGFKNLALRCVKIKKGVQWTALLFQRV